MVAVVFGGTRGKLLETFGMEITLKVCYKGLDTFGALSALLVFRIV